jgi:formamidopyrimidine-DNA glycosylase
MQLLSVKEVEEKLGRLGPDPFEKRLTAARFIDRFAKKRGSLKAALMDQTMISGIGSVYADEICFEAEVRPDAKIPVLQRETWERLYVSMHRVLKEAISKGGAGEQPFAAGDNLTGGYHAHFNVYNREGQMCPRCGATIVKMDVSTRKAYVCLSCQKDQ